MTDFLDEIEASLPSLRRYARGLLRDRERADDLVQDCLERALRKQKLWQPSGPLRPWLFKIMLNIFHDDLRKLKSRGVLQPLDELPKEPSVPARQGDRLLLNELANAIGALPVDQRQVLLLVTLEGFSYAEAAKLLEIPIGTLMSRLGRARAKLRHLKDDGPSLRSVK
jgi:RNA polymerase sigma-70 factor (ECF subfamily)